ncbi:dihydrofolate reductase [Streptococcus pacificus]|uniref:Dihydrofolate reductase n=1 Tax=Streptococcus pacificus TaxID=2740577 RepID=A0ABS0ZIJ6_9STRE|nr:dihydrofolate reductase [Streptococcus pacificus]MBJ8325663.1 dihydrofolate reductase [Streptococcus pacificus]
MTKKLIAIWAEDENHLIGNNGKLPWFLPKELNHFKEVTLGHTILMGRVTFEGMNKRVLPGRQTIILSRDKSYQSDGVLVLTSVNDVMEWFENQEDDLFIVGGQTIYKAFDGFYHQLIKTTIHGKFEGDAYFPTLDFADFQLRSTQFYPKDDKNDYSFTVDIFEKMTEKESLD